MKKQVLFILCSISLFFGQAKPPAYTLREATSGSLLHAEWIVHTQSLGVVEASIKQALVKMDWEILSASLGRPPLPALSLITRSSLAATKCPNDDPDKRQGLFVEWAINGQNATITADWFLFAGPSCPRTEAKQFYDEFFRRLAEILK